MLKKFICSCILIFLIMSFSGDLFARGKIVIAVSGGYEPYYMFKDGELGGICVDIVNQVAEKLKIDIKYEKYPWARCLYVMKAGEVDAMFPLFRTPERERYMFFEYGNILAPEENAFFARKESNINWTGNFEDMKPYTIGVIDQYSYGPKFDNTDYLRKEYISSKHVTSTQNAETILIRKLAAKRVDIVLGMTFLCRKAIKELGLVNEIEELFPVAAQDLLYISFSKAANSGKLAKRFAKAMSEFKKTIEYERILEKWGVLPWKDYRVIK